MCSSRHRYHHRQSWDPSAWERRAGAEGGWREPDPAPDFDPGPDPDVRASDAERERVVTLLREHAAAGRLHVDELGERVERAYAARSRGELAPLLADLPRLGTAGPGSAGAGSRTRARSGAGAGGEIPTWAAVSLLLVAIWLLSGAGAFWPAWAILPWGAAVLAKRAGRAHGTSRGGMPSGCWGPGSRGPGSA